MGTQGSFGYKIGRKIRLMHVQYDADMLWQTCVREIFILMKHFGSINLLCEAFEKLQEANKLIEDLKVFSLRQLNKDEDGRILLFLRLLQYLSKSEYKLRSDSVHYKYLEKLKQQPFKYRGLLNELEVVPYEKLWEILLSRLSKK
jgi:hypothetical protein